MNNSDLINISNATAINTSMILMLEHDSGYSVEEQNTFFTMFHADLTPVTLALYHHKFPKPRQAYHNACGAADAPASATDHIDYM